MASIAARRLNLQRGLQVPHNNTLYRPGFHVHIPRSLIDFIRQRYGSTVSENESTEPQPMKSTSPATHEGQSQSKPKQVKKLTVAEADEALRLSMSDIDGGGEHSIEMEGGKFVGLRRGVKDNMFRVI